MTKFKVSYSDSQIFVKSKLDKATVINQEEMNLFDSKLIRGLMRPKITGNRKIEYSAPANITLHKYLQSGLSKKEFYIVFAQLNECIKKIEHYSLNINNLVMDTRYTFYNQYTREVQFLYQPFKNPVTQNNIFSFIYQIASETVPNLDESNAFLNDLISFSNQLNAFSTATMEKYLMKVYPQVYKTVRKMMPGDSTSLKQTGRTYFEKKYDTEVVDDDDTDVLDEEADDNRLNDEGDTDLLVEEDDEFGTDVLEDDGGTTVLEGSEGTTVLADNTPSFPYLIRVNNYEKVSINKPVFRIGKEKSYVDYFVMNNSAVSRIHADIITQDNHCYVKDNNSTNHTFINGTMIGVNQKTEIFDGDALMLANEPFEFHIS